MADNDKPEEWFPRSKDDWAEVFASGIALDRKNRKDAEDKAAEEEAKRQSAEGGNGDNGDQRPKSFRDRLLG